MNVLVDASAWVDYLNGFASPAADALTDLLGGDEDVCTCGIVVAEVFPTVHCIIAALAEETGCALLARDSDMDAILDSGLLKTDRWPVAG